MQCTWEEYLWNVSGGCFFRLLPSFVMVGITHHLWQISIGSMCELQECREQNKQRERARRDAAARFDLCSLCSAAPLFLSSHPDICTWRNKPPSLGSSADNVERCEDAKESDYSSPGNSFRCYPDTVCFSQTSIKDKQHRFGEMLEDRGERDTRLCRGSGIKHKRTHFV